MWSHNWAQHKSSPPAWHTGQVLLLAHNTGEWVGLQLVLLLLESKHHTHWPQLMTHSHGDTPRALSSLLLICIAL